MRRVVVGIVLLVLLSPNSASAERYRKSTRRLGQGVSLTSIADPKGPWRIKVLTVNLAAESKLDVVLSNDRLAGLERTSSMGRRTGALAGINGDYARPDGRPVYAFADDGRLAQSPPPQFGGNFAFDEPNTHFGRRPLSSSVKVASTGQELAVTRFNRGAPSMQEIAAYSPVGGAVVRPPRFACSVRLSPLGPPARGAGSDHATPTVVTAQRCSATRMKRRGGIVLATPLWGPQAVELMSLEVADEVTFTWSFRDWPGIRDAIGGNPVLVRDGDIFIGRGTGSFFYRHPRTGVGATADGRVLLVTVDGRRPGRSVGMTPLGFAKLFKRLGARWAFNLDGGGSTTMFARGEVVNRPSDGSERPVSSALVVLPGDRAAPSAEAPELATHQERALRSIAADPASAPPEPSALRPR
ncbi:MAG: phosphodiester glycosidase family protein [Actinomycetota bacterium]|nr:phosphodiester glycosidase family protein [Actinomycetota bacterium]